MFIDDVYSNGKKSDGDYPLLSTAIAEGLFHPRCKDSTSTHYPELDDLGGPLSDDELAELDRQRGLEVQQQHAEKQAERFDRRAKYSLDEDNKKFAKARADEWHDRADKLAEKVKNAESNSSENVAKSSKGDILKEESKERFSGRYSASQERIDQLIHDDLSGINFTEKPVYNSRIRSNGKTTVREFADGTVKEVVKVEIGKQDNSSAEFLEDSILHEELEARIAIRSRYSKRYKELYKSNDDERHRYINRVIERYFKIKGWNYELATI